MLVREIINPQSIVVVGGTRNTTRPGGKMLTNLLHGSFKGELYVVNPHDPRVMGLPTFARIADLPEVELAILAIPARHTLTVVRELARTKNTRGFIIISAGFGEVDEDGKKLEQELAREVEAVGGTLIGPNCIGVINRHYQGVFTLPIPRIDSQGCDFISSSGAMAVFIMEAAVPVGLRFNSVFSVGNGAHTRVEDILAWMDESFDPQTSARTKLLYVEDIVQPQRFLQHCRSLINKGCRIAAIKGGITPAGSQAAASHTGAMATPGRAVQALFDKAGVVSCSSREELLAVASVFTYPPLKGRNIAIVTHAGGSAVLLTDALVKGGLCVPPVKGPDADELLSYLNPGSSVANPIDFLATGTADQLGIILDYCNYKFDHIDAIVVVFGSPGLFDVQHVYKVLNVKIEVSPKPIFPVLPSIVNAAREIEYFLSKGHVNFPDEVILAKALSAVYHTRLPEPPSGLPGIDTGRIRQLLDGHPGGWLSQEEALGLLAAAGLPCTRQHTACSPAEVAEAAARIGYPVAMKVLGPLHKTDVEGVVLNIRSEAVLRQQYDRLMAIEGATGVLIQEMVQGHELFLGAKLEEKFGHLILVGLGGVFLELLNDVQVGLAPLSKVECHTMFRRLQGYRLFRGFRDKPGIDEDTLAGIIGRLSALLQAAPQIKELDINPLMGFGKNLKATDVRIRI